MAKLQEESFCLACAWTGDRGPAGCPACSAQELAGVRGGALVAFPAGTVPCGKCGSTERPLVFRATSRVASFVWLILSAASAATGARAARGGTSPRASPTRASPAGGDFWERSSGRRAPRTSTGAPSGPRRQIAEARRLAREARAWSVHLDADAEWEEFALATSALAAVLADGLEHPALLRSGLRPPEGAPRRGARRPARGAPP